MSNLSAAQAAQQHNRTTDGRYAEKAGGDPGSLDLNGGPPQFIFNRDFDDHEQVRPYFDGYLARRAELEAAGQYPYNDSFKGHIPGLEGPNEGRGIYMLQQMYDRDEMQAKVDAFLADGGQPVDELDLPEGRELRGTLATFGFFMGGTGYSEQDVWLSRTGDRVMIREPRARTKRWVSTPRMMFRPSGQSKAGS